MKVFSFSLLMLWLLSSMIVGTIDPPEPVTYKIDPNHTSITTKVNRFTMVNVVGRFIEVSGSITFDSSNPEKSSAIITINTASYTANNNDGENAVKSPAFLDVTSYPEITFESKSLTKSDNGFIAKGDLTIHGTTNEVEFPLEITGPFKDPTGLNTIGIRATLNINRQDYGIKFDRKLSNGKDLIGNEVQIEINLLAAE